MKESRRNTLRVLLVEDNPADARLLVECMKGSEKGLEFVDPGSLAEALEMLSAGVYDVVLLDLSLPDAQGLEGLMRICELFPEVPVLVLSGLDDVDVAAEAVRQGAQDYIVKGSVDCEIISRSIRYAVERAAMTRALRESEERLRALFDCAPDTVVIADPDTGFLVDANPAASKLFGRPVEEIRGLHQSELHPPAVAEEMKRAFSDRMREMQEKGHIGPVEVPVMRPDGSIRSVEIRDEMLRLRDRTVVQAIFRDITERKRYEEALRDSRESLANAQRIARLGNWDWDIVTNDLGWSDEIYRIFGVNKKGFGDTYDAFLGFVHPDDKELVDKAVKKALYEGRPYSIDHRIVLPDGTVRTVHEQAEVAFDEDGKPLQMSGTVQDITERKEAEEEITRLVSELGHKNRLLDTILSTTPVHIYMNDSEGRYTYASKSGADAIGLAPEDIAGRHWRELGFPPEIMEPFDRHRESVLRTGESVTSETRFPTVDGTRYYEYSVDPIRDENGAILSTITTSTDITERKRMEEELRKAHCELEERVRERTGELEEANDALQGEITERRQLQEQLIQAQKMEAVGALTGGIAHDFNNIMTIIKAFSTLAVKEGAWSDKLLDYLDRIQDATDRATNLTRQLLIFSRRLPTEPVVLDMNSTAGEFLKVLMSILGANIRVKTDFAPGVSPVSADKGHVEQLILNLVVNARDAMPRGGEITIRTENVTLGEKECEAAPGAEPGEFVCLTVEDTGMGMDKEVIDHVFEPFYTTKEDGKGTGLGLAVVHNIVKDNGGFVTASSEPGRGSSFRACFPVTTEPVKAGLEKSLTKGAEGRGERVLLVEDEKMLLMSLALVMKRNGYAVSTAESAEEATAVFEKEGGRFDLVISDTVLPDRSGIHLVKDLSARKPGLAILLTSGYMDIESQWPEIIDRGYGFLQKPYEPEDLLMNVRETLEKTRE